jgi:ribonuclease D
METLAHHLLGFEDVKKPTFIGRSEWDDYPLQDEQVQYASVDAFLSFKMGKALHVWNWNR